MKSNKSRAIKEYIHKQREFNIAFTRLHDSDDKVISLEELKYKTELSNKNPAIIRQRVKQGEEGFIERNLTNNPGIGKMRECQSCGSIRFCTV